MSRRSMSIGLVGGIAVSALVLLVLPVMNRSAFWAVDPARLRIVLLWFALLGMALGAAIISSKRYPLVVAVPAVLLGYGYYVISYVYLIGPPGRDPLLGTWIPDALVLRFLRSFSPAALVLVGVLAAVAVWRIGQSYRQKPLTSGAVVGRRDMIVGTLGGIGAAIALLRSLGWAEHALFGLPDDSRQLIGLLGYFVIGALLGGLIILNDRLPFLAVSAAAALGLFVLVHPALEIVSIARAWSFQTRYFFQPLGDIVLIVGILLALAVWHRLSTRHSDSQVAAQE